MKKLFILLACLILTGITNAQQIHLKQQKGFEYKRMPFLDSLNIKEPDFDTLAIELRFLHVEWSVIFPNAVLWQIKKDKNGYWSGFSHSFLFYNPEHYDFNAIVTPLYFGNTWQSSWDSILHNGFLNLPDENSIEIKCVPLCGGLPLILGIGGGDLYTVEILTKEVRRIISYSNPAIKYEDYIEEYGVDCYAIDYYRKFIEFINLLKNGLSDGK